MQKQKEHTALEHELEILGGEDIATKERPSVSKVTFAAAIGATVEWYDFFLYGLVAALIFNKQFFPSEDPLVGTMLAYGTFAVGFLARPVGGVVFGHFGDRVGRKSMLVLTLIIMGAATVIIGLLPNAPTIMIAEKTADMILEDARRGTAVELRTESSRRQIAAVEL